MPINRPPTLDPVSDLRAPQNSALQVVILTGITAGLAEESQPLTITASSSHPALIPHPQIGPIRAPGAADLTFATLPGARGSVIITVTVNDGQELRSIASRTFLVNINDPPEISPLGSVMAEEDAPIDPIRFSVNDSDDPLKSIQVTAQSSNPAVVAQSGLLVVGSGRDRTLSVITLPNASGSALITLVARDPSSNSTAMTFLLSVLPVNDPPTMDPIPDIVIDRDDAWASVELSGIRAGASDEMQTLTVTARTSDPAIVSVPLVSYMSSQTSGVLFLNPVPAAIGVAEVTVTVLDHGEGTDGGVNRFNRTFRVSRVAAAINPRLRIEASSSGANISWPTNQAAGFVLQTATELGDSGRWSNVPTAAVTINDRFVVSVPAAEIGRFFRLWRGASAIIPSLKIEASISGVIVSWPTNQAAGFVLQMATELGDSGRWSKVPTAADTSNDRFVVSLPATDVVRFFRLCRECAGF